MKLINLVPLAFTLNASNAQTYSNVLESCQQMGYCRGAEQPDACFACQLNLGTYNERNNIAGGLQSGQPGYVDPQFPTGSAPTPMPSVSLPVPIPTPSSDRQASASASSGASASESATPSASASSDANASATPSSGASASQSSGASGSASRSASSNNNSSSSSQSGGACMVAGSMIFGAFSLIASLLI